MSKLREAIGSLLRERREAMGLTQTQVAEKMGQTQTCISQWEIGERTPGVEALAALSELYQTSMNEILERAKERL